MTAVGGDACQITEGVKLLSDAITVSGSRDFETSLPFPAGLVTSCSTTDLNDVHQEGISASSRSLM